MITPVRDSINCSLHGGLGGGVVRVIDFSRFLCIMEAPELDLVEGVYPCLTHPRMSYMNIVSNVHISMDGKMFSNFDAPNQGNRSTPKKTDARI